MPEAAPVATKRFPALGQSGLALVWLIITMTVVASIGAAMVSFYSASTSSHLGVGMTHQAALMAESGRRFFESEYRNIGDEEDKNEWMANDVHNRTFNPVAGENHRFKIGLASYFYRLESDPGSGDELRLQFVGSGGFDPTTLSSGYLRIDGSPTIYGFTGGNVTTEGTGDDTVYVISSINPNVDYGAADVNTGVYSVVSSDYNSVAGSGGTLTLDALTSDAALQALFPEKNGMFLIEKQEIRENLPVATTVPYRYEYRSGTQLVNVTKGPKQKGFTDIDAANPGNVEVAKFVEVTSTGSFENQASLGTTYRLAVPSATSTPGLVSSWSFDDTETPSTAADDYGTADGSLGGDAQFTTSDVKVGTGAVVFSGGGYIETDFNPAVELGSNRPFTVTFWAKPDTITAEYQRILGSQNESASRYFYIGISNNFSGKQWIWGYGNVQSVFDPNLPDVDENQWQHIAWQYDGSYIVIYKNGREVYRQAYFGTGYTSDIDIDIGGALFDDGQRRFPYSGVLDEVAIFNEALAICEVRAIYNVPCNVGCDALAYYPFTGNADDESGAARDGIYDGTAYFGASLTTDRFGCEEEAYAFDGLDDHIRTSFNPETVIGDLRPFTIAFWAKVDTVPSGLRPVVGNIDLDLQQRWYVAINEGEWLWAYGDSFGPLDGTLPDVAAGQWVHVGVVYDDSTGNVRLYVNDSEYIYPYTGDGDVPDLNVYLGTRNALGTGAGYFEGAVDEIVYWGEAKTKAFMENLYYTTKPD